MHKTRPRIGFAFAWVAAAALVIPATVHAQTTMTPATTKAPAAEVLGPPAPGEEPLDAGPPGSQTTVPGDADADNVHGTSTDLLVENGLRSPWCTPGRSKTAEAERNCQTGGLTSSGAAGDNLSFDRHVDTSTWTGAPKIDRWFISIVLTILSFGWSLMVTATRGVFAALEFAFAFNPLDTAHRGSLAQTLDHQVRTVTRPLALLLAPVGGVWIMWRTTVERRPGHAASQALLSSVLVIAALVLLANPVGTVGAALTASQRVGLAVIGTTAGQPSNGERATQSGLQAIAAGVIDQPLALLEFGDVDWGTNPDRLDPKLQAAALELARDENPEKVAAVRAARSNLDLFQVWPANSKQRNSINDEHSLLRVLCGNDEDTKCPAPTGRYAEFRTERGAWQRALGLVVILLGLIPFWIALLYVAVKIIAAGLLATIRLIQLSFLVPLALIGEHGNRRIVGFFGDFAGNVLTAAAYSFFLGLIMLMWRLITTWPGYGFVMQWLLLALTLWLLIVHRQSLWGTARAPRSAAMSLGTQIATRAGAIAALRGARQTTHLPRRATRLTGSGLRTARRPITAARERRRQATPTNGTGRSRRSSRTAGGPVAGTSVARNGQAPPISDGPHRAGPEAVGAGGEDSPNGARPSPRVAQRIVSQQDDQFAVGVAAHRERAVAGADLSALRRRRTRIAEQRQQVDDALPQATGRQRVRLVRRRASLQTRAAGVQGEIRRAEATAQRVRAAQENPRRDRVQLAARLDEQAERPRGERIDGPRRQYAQLTPLISASPEDYRTAPAPQRLQMRADIDRQLERRSHARQLIQTHEAAANRAQRTPTPRRDQHDAAPVTPAPASRPTPLFDPEPDGSGEPGIPRRSRPPRTDAERRRAFREQARRRD